MLEGMMQMGMAMMKEILDVGEYNNGTYDAARTA